MENNGEPISGWFIIFDEVRLALIDLLIKSKLILFKDKERNIQIRPKDGSGPGDPTGISIKDLF